jgi:hypothetical protein
MADFKFSCPHCSTVIECDELWCGREIQCPSCQKEFAVPQKPAGGIHASFAVAKSGQSKLSIGASQAHQSSAPKAIAPQAAALEQQLKAAKAGQKGNAMKWVTAGIVVVVLGAGGYFGYGYYTKWQDKKAEAARLAAAPPPATNAAPAEPEPAPPPPPAPVIPVVWTLDVDHARIPEAKANGTISGTNFLVETAVCSPQYLGLYEGAIRSPDAAVVVYLNLRPGESLTNRSFTVSPDKRDPGVRTVAKLWKTNPHSPPHNNPFSSGYALKLDFGDAVSNTISGKIFLALPDTEQTVVAGQFKAFTAMPAAPSATMAAQPAAPPPRPMAARPADDSRYGKKR